MFFQIFGEDEDVVDVYAYDTADAPLAVDYLLIVLGYCPRPNAKELGSCPVSRILAIVQGNPGFQSTWLPGQVSLVWQPLGSHCQTNIQKRTVSTKGKSPKKESHQISL